jgi:uncharacterized membrane protein
MSEKWFMIIVNFPIILSILAIGLITPNITRKDIFFGIRIPEEQMDNPELKNLKREYNRNYLLTCGVFSILIFASMFYFNNPLISVIGILILPGISFLNYYAINRKVSMLKEINNWSEGQRQMVVVDTGFRSNKGKRIVASPWWFLIPVTIAVANGIIAYSLYDSLPNRIPTHWNFMGEADAWSDKSLSSVLNLPMIQIFVTGAMYFSYKMIERSKQQISPRNAEVSREQNRLFRLRWSAYTIVLCIMISLMFTFINFISLNIITVSGIGMSAIMMAFIIPILIGSIFMSLWTGQGGSRIKISEDKEINENVVGREDDKHWKLGVFYFNPSDPALFIEKRFGVGWTINFGRPLAIVMFLGITLLVVLGPLVLSILS